MSSFPTIARGQFMSFLRTMSNDTAVRFTFEDRSIEARPGDSIAAALLAAGVDRNRSTPKERKPRLPYCLMGVCFDCLVEVDGTPNCQACMVEVKDGMQVRRQELAREVQP